ncbi:MAG: major capsid protein P2 [Telluria sp.]
MGARLKTYPFQNVVASGVATCDLNSLLGYTVERLILRLAGTAFTKSMITGIVLKANGKIIYDTTGPRLDSRNQYRGITANAGFLTIDFAEIRAKTELGQNLGCLDTTVGISNLKLEVTISGATAPVLEAFAEVNSPQMDPAQAATKGLIAKVHATTMTIGASGQFAIPVPHAAPADGGSILKRIAFFSANMTGLLVKKNGIVIEESTKALNDFNQTEYRKTPQAGMYVFDAIVDDIQSQVLNTRNAQTLEILATFSAGETITVESELLEPLGAF